FTPTFLIISEKNNQNFFKTPNFKGINQIKKKGTKTQKFLKSKKNIQFINFLLKIFTNYFSGCKA
ncbi:hypothetical protein, partial [Staphylococcus hyicus]